MRTGLHDSTRWPNVKCKRNVADRERGYGGGSYGGGGGSFYSAPPGRYQGGGAGGPVYSYSRSRQAPYDVHGMLALNMSVRDAFIAPLVVRLCAVVANAMSRALSHERRGEGRGGGREGRGSVSKEGLVLLLTVLWLCLTAGYRFSYKGSSIEVMFAGKSQAL